MKNGIIAQNAEEKFNGVYGMSEELKRCGCGGEAIADMDENWYYFWVVKCPKCGIQTNYYQNKEKAIEVWNRAMGERTAKVESLVLTTYPSQTVWQCGECGKLILGQVNYCPICGARLEWE